MNTDIHLTSTTPHVSITMEATNLKEIPVREKESKIVTCFLNYFPDITKLLHLPFIKQIGCCKYISKNIDPIGLTVVITSIAITTIAGIGVFYANFLIVKISLFSIECFSGIIAIFSTGGYVKKYYLLKRIQQEVKILQKYSEILNQTLTEIKNTNKKLEASNIEIENSYKKISEENLLFKENNCQLNDSLQKSKGICKALSTKIVGFEQQKNAMEKLNIQLRQTSSTLESKLKNLTQENVSLSQNNRNLQTLIASLKQTVESTTKEFENLKKADKTLCNLYSIGKEYEKQIANLCVQKNEMETILTEHRKQIAAVTQILSIKKEELDSVTERLDIVTKKLEQAAASVL